MRKTAKICGIIAAVLLLLIVVAVAGAWFYANSSAGRSLVAEKVSEQLGGEVRIDSLGLGASSTSVTLALPAGDPQAPLFAGTIDLDKSAYALAGGADIGAVTVTDATIILRINADNDVVTEFPKPKKSEKKTPLPVIKVENAAVKFLQDGRSEFGFKGVTATAKEVGDQLDIQGSVNDPDLGKWAVSGQWASNGDTGAVDLVSDGPVRLTPERLRSIPFIPPSTWDSVIADGEAGLKVRVARVEGGKWTWHVEVTPTAATLTAKALEGLVVTNTSGKLVVDGKQIVITDIKGDTAGGKVKLDAKLDFAPEPSTMHFDVVATNLDVDKLPKDIGLQGRVANGRLNGAGSVDLTVGDKVKPVGVTGKAVLKGSIPDVGGELEITVSPKVVGNELKFDDAGPTARFQRPTPLLTLVALAVQAPPEPAAKPAAPAKQEPPKYLKANIKLRDVDLAKLLAKANVTLPVPISGKVTLEVAAEIPTNSPGTIRSYRAQGKVSVPQLTVQGLTLNNLEADANFRDGILALSKLGGEFPAAAGAKPPSFAGTARFAVDPRGELSADLKLDRVPLEQLFAAVPSLKGKAAGAVSGEFKVKGDGTALGDLAKYDATGTLNSDALTLFGQDAKQVGVNLALANGVAKLTKLTAKLKDGGIDGRATVPLVGNQTGEVDLVLKGFDATFFAQLADSPVPVSGPLGVNVKATIPPVSNFDAAKLAGRFHLDAPSLKVGGATLNNLLADATFKQGVLELSQFSANMPPPAKSAPGANPPGFAGTAKLGLSPRTDLTANLKLDRVPLAQVFAAIPGQQGKASGALSGDFKLTAPADALGEPAKYDAAGDLHSDALTLYGQHAKKFSVLLKLKDGVASLKNLSADLYDGGLAGDVALPLAGDKPGDFDIIFKGIDAGALTKAIPDSPIDASGIVSGHFKGTLPPLPEFDATKISGKLDLEAPKLVVQGVPTTKLKGNVGYKPGAIAYDLKGDLLGGDFDVVGEYPLGEAPAKPAAPAKQAKGEPGLGAGKLRVSRIQLDRLGPTLRIEGLDQLRGEASLTLDYELNAQGRPTGVGKLDLRGLKYGDVGEGSTLSSPVRLTGKGVELSSLSGRFLDGRLGGRVIYGFTERSVRRAVLYLEGADAEQIFAPMGVPAEGRVSVRLETGLNREIRGGGTVTAARAKIKGINVLDLRVPLTWTVARGGRSVAGEVAARGVTGNVAGGRITGRAEATYRDSARVNARLDFINLNVADLSGSSFGIGRATGSVNVAGNDVKSVDDLVGSINAKFGETDVASLPVIGTITTVISPISAFTRFDNGDLTARLGDGQLRIEQLALNSKAAQLHAEGTVNLNGRLDLDVIYATDSLGGVAPGLRLIARNIPAIGPIPVGLIVRISEALSNRIIRVRVGGTADRPTYSVNAARLLSENAVRYFTGQYTGGLSGSVIR